MAAVILVENTTFSACLEGSGLKDIFHLNAQSTIHLRSLFSIADEII